MRSPKNLSISLAFALALSCACGDPETGADAGIVTNDDAGSVQQSPLVPDTATVDAECDEQRTAASACAWSESVDAVLVAVVTDFVLDRAHALWRTEDGWQVVEDCPSVNPALVVGLDVERVLRGTAPERVALRVGAQHLGQFSPFPYEEDGAVIWSTTHLPGRGPLFVGQRIIVPITRAGDAWSLAGNVFIGLDGDTLDVRPGVGDCLALAPVGLHGVALDVAAGQFAACPTTTEEGAELRNFLNLGWVEPLTRSVAPHCLTLDDDPTQRPDAGGDSAEGYEEYRDAGSP